MNNHHNNQEIDVPPYFLCPISLQIMKDPVTISTGITYDRVSIETWVYTNNKTICPVTKQALNIDANTDIFLTPNHTLRRLIQSWCTINASYGIERFPTPKPPITKAQILKLINEAKSSLSCQSQLINYLNKIKSIALESNANKRCLETTHEVFDFLIGLIILEDNNKSILNNSNNVSVSDEALRILSHLEVIDELILRKILNENEEFLLNSLVKVIQKSSYELRAYAIQILKIFVEVADPTQLTSVFKREHFIELVQLIKDEISPRATKDTLKTLALVCPYGRNRVRVVEAGVVKVLVDLLIETKERRISEMVLSILDHLCGCAEGRAELLGHAGGLAVVSKKMLRVSHFGTDKCVKILFWVSKHSASASVVQEMLEIGVVVKLCLVLQVECEGKTKEKVREIFRLHGKVWRNSLCVPSHFFGGFN